MPIPDLPLFKHRDTVVTPADQNQFVTQFENTMDTMSNDVIPTLNLAIIDINENVITATTARDEAVSARNIAVSAKDEALTAVATLQEGAIDDNTIALNKAFSNQYVDTNIYKKTEIDEITIINNFIDKPTPVNTDNLALQETGGLLKKLSFANLKNTLLDYFGVKISSDGFSIKNARGGNIKNQCTAFIYSNASLTPPSILNSYNISTIVRNSIGNYTITFIENMQNINYLVVGNYNQGLLQGSIIVINQTIDSIIFETRKANDAGFIEPSGLRILIFGGKN